MSGLVMTLVRTVVSPVAARTFSHPEGSDVSTSPTSALVVASRAQTTTRCAPARRRSPYVRVQGLQSRTTVQVMSSRTIHLN